MYVIYHKNIICKWHLFIQIINKNVNNNKIIISKSEKEKTFYFKFIMLQMNLNGKSNLILLQKSYEMKCQISRYIKNNKYTRPMYLVTILSSNVK